MTHRIVVNVQTGEITQIEYTPEEQAVHNAAVAAQAAELEMQQTKQQKILDITPQI